MAASKRRGDRRTQRTRQMLQQAFLEVAREKGFASTSIQDITDRANVNRGTFYLHFTDKYMLADTIIREDFHRLLTDTLPPMSRWDRRTLHLLIQSMLDYFERKYRHRRLPHDVALLVEQAIHEELTGLLLTWLKQLKRAVTREAAPLETMARVVSWAIFGTALQWSQEETTMSSEQMAHAILLVVLEGVCDILPHMHIAANPPSMEIIKDDHE